MKIQGVPEINGDTGEKEIAIVMTNKEIKWLKSAAYQYNGDEYGDELPTKIRAVLLECKNKLNPS